MGTKADLQDSREVSTQEALVSWGGESDKEGGRDKGFDRRGGQTCGLAHGGGGGSVREALPLALPLLSVIVVPGFLQEAQRQCQAHALL